MKKLALTAALVALTSSAFAFQTEVIATAINTDIHEAAGADFNTYGAVARFHAAPVSTKNVPIAEAAFLAGSNFAEVGYAHIEGSNSDALGVLGEYHVGRFFAGLGMSFNTKSDNAGQEDGYTGRSLYVGYDVIPGMSVWANYANTQNTIGKSGSTDAIWGVKAKYVKPFGTKAINLEAGYDQGLDKNANRKDDIYSAAADFYFTPRVSVGVTGIVADGDTLNDGYSVYGVRTTAYVTPNLSVGAFANHSDKNSYDFDQVGVKAGLHF